MKKYLFICIGMLTPVSVALAVGCGKGSGASNAGLTTLCNPIESENFTQFLVKVIDIILMLSVPVLTIAFLWCGFRFVWARGNPTELGVARNNLLWTFIGAAIIIGVKVIALAIEATLSSLVG